MKFERTDVWGFEHAIRGARNPMNSWDRSDSYFCEKEKDTYYLGEKDLDLAQRLIKGGSEHRKFMRQIMVSVDITAPLYWFKEFDTYKIGTTANSTSTMHKLASTEITIECFETDDAQDLPDSEDEEFVRDFAATTIASLEYLRDRFNETKDMRYWKELVRWLPESWLQTRTVTLNYEILRNIYFQRKGHKLTEWRTSRGFPTGCHRCSGNNQDKSWTAVVRGYARTRNHIKN